MNKCLNCGRKFIPDDENDKFCSEGCLNEFENNDEEGEFEE